MHKPIKWGIAQLTGLEVEAVAGEEEVWPASAKTVAPVS